LRIGAKRELIPDMDSLPWPHRETLPLDRYKVGGFPAPVLYMYASRGCPYQCTFCVWPQWFQSGSYRARSPRSVADEIEDAQRRWGPFRSIYFDDDTFNIGKPRMLEMADEFARRSLQIPWGCNARPDLFDDEMMRRLADAGLFTIRIGVESADPDVLKRTKKNLDLAAVSRCIDLAHRYRVKVHVTFTIGLSGESWETVKRTASFARSIAADSVAFTITTPFPGTSYYDEVVRDGYLASRQWGEFNVLSNSVVRTATMSREEIVKAEKYVMRKVYFSPEYLFRRLRYAASPMELSALAKKGVSFVLGRF
jgi:anaerobic magnesium-protoporphyrin IX monomethyl ester cyclase